jgi:hypothetical protein
MLASATRRAVCVLSVSLAAAALPSVAAASPIEPTLSCWLIEYPPSTQCDGGGWVGRTGPSGISPDAVPNTRQNTVVRFDDVSSIPSTAVVTEATLSAYQDDEQGVATKTVSVFGVTTDWDNSATWGWPWTNLGGDFTAELTTFDSPGDEQWSADVDVTDIVAAWVSGAEDNYGFGLSIPDTEDNVDHAVHFGDFVLDVDYYVP